MTLPGPPANSMSDIVDVLRRLEARVNEMDRKTLANASISKGGLTIRDGGGMTVLTPDGTAVLHIGELNNGLTAYQGMTLSRPDGTRMFLTAPPGSDPAVIYWAWLDHAGSVTVSEDSTAGQGLARPNLGIPVQDQRWDQLPSTPSATFDAVQTTNSFYKQQPKAFVQIRHCSTDSGTAGETRLMLDGVQVGSTIATGFTAAWTNVGPFAVSGSHMSQHNITLECRRTSGAGRVGASMVVRGEAS